MKKNIAFLLVLFCTSFGFSQTFFEGFENTNGPQATPSTAWPLSSGVWAVFDTNVGGTERWKLNTEPSNVHSGNRCAYVTRQNIAQGIVSEEYLATPLVNIPTNGKLRFYSRTFTAGDQGTLYQVKIAPGTSSQTNTSAYVVYEEYTEQELSTFFNVYDEKIIDLSSYAGQNVYIAFVKKYTQPTSALTGDRWLLDDVSIESGSSCASPANLVVAHENSNFNLNWENNANAVSWEVLAIPCNQTVPATGISGIATTTSSYTMTGLDPNICYNFCVRSICSDTTVSNWSIVNVNTLGTLNTDCITAKAFLDNNTDGIYNTGDTLFEKGSYSFELNNSGTVQYTPSTMYGFRTYCSYAENTADFGFQILPEYLPYYSLATSSYNDISFSDSGTVGTLYFPITQTQPFEDVSIHLNNNANVRPGLNHQIWMRYKNESGSTASGTITFVKAPQATIVNTNLTGAVMNANGFTYNFTNLAPGTARNIILTVSLPPIPTVNIDDILTSSVNIALTSGTDAILINNSQTLTQTVISSYDPNNKTESHGGQIEFDEFTSDDYLYYTVNFQNLGNAAAINVKIEDALDPKLDETTIQMIETSHEEYSVERINNNLVWEFENIQLQPASVNEEFSMGHVFFKVKPKPGYAIGDIIPNTASIYFDTNPAIVTNTTYTEFVDSLGTTTFGNHSIVIAPNPANESINILLQNTSENLSLVTITDVVGKIIRSIPSQSQNQTIDVSDLSKGIYLLEINTQNGLKQTKKLIKK